MSPTLKQLEVFYGELNQHVAHVYVRLPNDQSGIELRGMVSGPFSEYSKTLPTRIPLQSLPPTETLLARGIATDPCYWDGMTASRYRVDVELVRNGEVVESTTREIGLRQLLARGRSLRRDGKRWVLRACRVALPATDMLETCREKLAALCTAAPSDELCTAASLQGVTLVVEVSEDDADKLRQRLFQLSKFPAIACVIVDGQAVLKDTAGSFKSAAPNLLYAHRPLDSERIGEWADVVAVDRATTERMIEFSKRCTKPFFAVDIVDEPTDLLARRAACDNLQRQLVKAGDFAGYIA
ncbi:MAG: hypothetical protein ACI9HK_000955 [Pirellulaceae bacterium]|jgi:hypothetical protein